MKILYTDGVFSDSDDSYVVVEFKEHCIGKKKYGGVALREDMFGEKPMMSEFGFEFFSKWIDYLEPYEKDLKLEEKLHEYLKKVGMDESVEE